MENYGRTPTPSATPSPTPSPSPAPGSTTTTPPVYRYPTAGTSKDAPTIVTTPLQKAQEQFYGSLPKTAYSPKEELILRDNTRQQFQSQIDATNSYYDSLVNAEKPRAEGRIGQSRAINARSGTLGQDFGNAATEKVVDYNKDIVKGIDDERNFKISGIFDKIDQRVFDQIEKRRTEALTNSASYLDYLKTSQTDARENVTALAGLGVTPDQLSEEDFKKVLGQTGYSDAQLRLTWNAALPANQKRDYEYKEINGKMYAISLNPETKKPELMDLGVEVPPDWSFTIAPDGTPLIYNKQGEAKVAEGFGSGQFRDPLDDQLKKAQIYKLYHPDSGSGDGGGDPGDNPQLYSGLSTKTATAVRAKVGQFKAEPVVQNFAVIQDGRNFASSIATNTKNPADDQALIYSLAKALDPGSVVREGEYATAQKYAQSWINAYGKGVTQAIAGTGFLSQTARENIKKTIEGKYTSSKRSYDNLYKQYESGVNSLTGRSNGSQFLIDYATAASAAGGGDQGGDNAPSANPGDIVEVNGSKYVVGPDGDSLTPYTEPTRSSPFGPGTSQFRL